jgi:hypothetical protein
MHVFTDGAQLEAYAVSSKSVMRSAGGRSRAGSALPLQERLAEKI